MSYSITFTTLFLLFYELTICHSRADHEAQAAYKINAYNKQIFSGSLDTSSQCIVLIWKQSTDSCYKRYLRVYNLASLTKKVRKSGSYFWVIGILQSLALFCPYQRGVRDSKVSARYRLVLVDTYDHSRVGFFPIFTYT